ncbi:hypothetical protein [uncultured Thiocystis sp.]|jgi:hypothetical protein|uniref:hypothetical protein n=1 Tax=uncultured Thiocystis sp. TaxID=1202134 RepID=UPI0025E14701|nr:hypothetical protein [uncultured Thiocystis sp.]
MKKFNFTLIVGILLISGSALADGNLVGKWVEVEGSRHGAKAGTTPHGAHVGDRYVAESELILTLTVEKQENRSFHAQWCSQYKCEDVVGVIRRDGTLLMADEDGTYTGTLLGDTLELCYTQASPAFRLAACRDMVKQ